MKRFYLLSLLSFFVLISPLWSQETKLDSLKMELLESDGEGKVEVLMALGEVTFRKENVSSQDYYSKAFRLSKIPSSQIDCLVNLINLSYFLKQGDSINYFIDRALDISREMNDTLLMVRFNVEKAYSFDAKGDYIAAKKYNQKSLELYLLFMKNPANVDKLDPYKYALICNNLGAAYTNLGIYDSAFYYMLISLQEKEKLNVDPRRLGIGFVNLGGICNRKEDYAAAIEYVNKGLEFSNRAKDSLMYIRGYNHLGVSYKKTGDTVKALEYYHKSLELCDILGRSKSTATVLVNLGIIYTDLKQWEKSKEYMLRALAINKRMKDISGISNSFSNLAHHYLNNNENDSAIVYALKSLSFANATGEILTSSMNYKILKVAYSRKNDFEKAFEAQESYFLLHDSIYNAESDERFMELQTKYQTAETDKENLQLNYDLEVEKTQKQRLWWGMAALLLVFGFSAFLVRMKRKKDRLLHEKEQIVLKREKELAKAELEKSQLKEQELKMEIQYKSRQLTTHALNMMQKNTLMQEIQEELVAIAKKANHDNKPALNRIKMLIKKNLRSEKDWDLFKLYFEDVNKQFYEELAKISRDLTPNDLKLCALLKLNMNIKESASVMNIEPASVKTARYKLRKKLDLRPEDDLVEFIRKIG
ncbi:MULTISPECIES: tetratricopeptide repeat protein [unclassified Lentimicrobium]|uniref:tetratricopeptide repeat protein n=1 Tax=unclassified Lentimicrobium TaxID=2677434 RepID=UPI0015550386|nr:MULTISPECIES: tetratricopeptide repeat protein [unclassified Lentimicrobium]NPD46888.1 tetratricopeptide repeat protein [Lentimicrobium sp. S6]NPD83846.1 tetratricopeptide repeat protein [Lentimicrobium sp. L6]